MPDSVQHNIQICVNPGYTEEHSNLAHVYTGLGRYGEAIIEFQEAIRLDPKYVLARNNLGHVYIEQEKYEDAIKEFEQVTKLDSRFIEAHQGMGLACYNKGRYDKAAHAWARAVYLKPELMDTVPDELKLKVNSGCFKAQVL